MVIWGIVWGAVLGWLWPGSWGEFASILGGIVGLFAGLSLRWAVRSEVASRHEAWANQEKVASPYKAWASQGKSTAIGAPNPVDPENFGPEDFAPEGFTPLEEASMDPADALVAASQQAVDSALASTGAAPLSLPFNADEASEAPAPSRASASPAQPAPIDAMFTAARNWLLGGNTVVRVGLVILFIGLSFLARYAAVAGLFPVELRLAAIGSAGIALLAVGFRKRLAKPGFALALQGGGVAVMYLTIFAAFRLYGLVPPMVAFGLMIVVCALSCVLALMQNAPVLAFAAFAGGFAVPILLSTGEGNHVGLFSYYMLLNLAILFIAWKRSWRVLNVLGFVATFGVATWCGVLQYSPANYASTQPFLIGFVLIYVFAAILYARNTPTRLGNAVDSTLVFGTPLVGFGLQAGLVHHMELGSAFSALGFAAVYLLLAVWLVRRAQASFRLLVESFLAVGVGFVALAVPLALNAQWTSAVWALQGAGAFWVGMRQARWLPRLFGLLLQGAAMVTFLDAVGERQWAWPIINPPFMGAMLIALPTIMVAWWLRRRLPHSETRWAKLYAGAEAQLPKPVFLLGFAFWCLAWLLEIGRVALPAEVGALPILVFVESTADLLLMLALLLSALLAQHFGLARQWAVATWPARATLAVMASTLLVQVASGHRVLDTPAWLVWPIALALHYWMLRQGDQPDSAEPNAATCATPVGFARWLHVGSVWLVTLLLADLLWFWIDRGALWNSAWAGVVMLVSAIGVLLLLAVWGGRANQRAQLEAFAWPRNPHAASYYWQAAVPLAGLVYLLALVGSVVSSGKTDPLPYIPLLNPTDLALALAVTALVFWRRVVAAANPVPLGSGWLLAPAILAAVAGLAFVAVNTVWLRIAHHFFNVRWDSQALFNSFVVQTGYAILWTLMAFGLMVLAHRRVHRKLWLVGAGLLGLVVVKLLLVDLSNVGGVERIVTFIVVGVMMLMVGYFAPLPPNSLPETEAQSVPS